MIAARRVRWIRQQARVEQLPPLTLESGVNWRGWLLLAGRGSGKTRTAAEELCYRAIETPKSRWAIIAPTFGDGRDICVEGESGVQNILESYGMLRDWNRSSGEVFLTNRSRMKIYSAEKPERLRGPQHHGGWFDELASMDNAQEIFDQYKFGLRLGNNPQTIVTTTPRPIKIIKDLLKDPTWVITRGSTMDNVENLPAEVVADLYAKYANTRLGRQELFAEILEDVEGALWTHALIDDARIEKAALPQLTRIVVGIDPAVSNTESSDSTGIVVVGIDSKSDFYVLSDKTLKASPQKWAEEAISAYRHYSADTLVAERNNGGDMVENTIRNVDRNVPVITVWASRGKALRAEPVSALYEQGRVHHVGYFGELEEEMCEWTPDKDGENKKQKSPDRLDALVWAITELTQGGNALASLSALAIICESCGFANTKNAIICFNPMCKKPLGVEIETTNELQLEGLTNGRS